VLSVQGYNETEIELEEPTMDSDEVETMMKHTYWRSK
jgi:hypothetical protein